MLNKTDKNFGKNLNLGSTNVPSNFLNGVCAQNFLCATFYQHSSLFRCVKYVQKTILKENLSELQVFLCVLISHRRNIGLHIPHKWRTSKGFNLQTVKRKRAVVVVVVDANWG